MSPARLVWSGRHPFVAAAAAVMLAGCVRVQSERVAAVRYEPVVSDSVRLFLSETELRDRGYAWETVAVLFVSGSADFTSERGLFRKAREHAGQLGANGMLLSEQREPTTGERRAHGSFADRRTEVVAVRWWPYGAEPPRPVAARP